MARLYVVWLFVAALPLVLIQCARDKNFRSLLPDQNIAKRNRFARLREKGKVTTTTEPYIYPDDQDDGIYTERENATETIATSPEPKRTTVTFLKPNVAKLNDSIKPKRKKVSIAMIPALDKQQKTNKKEREDVKHAKVSTTMSSVLYKQQNTTVFEVFDQEETTMPGEENPEDVEETTTSRPEPKRTTVALIEPKETTLIDVIKLKRKKVSTTMSSALYKQQNTTAFGQEETTTPGQKNITELEYIYPVTQMQDYNDDLNTTTPQDQWQEEITELPMYLKNYTISTKEPLDDIIPLSDDLPPIFEANATIAARISTTLPPTTLPQINTTTLEVRVRSTSSPPPIVKISTNATVINDKAILDAVSNAFSPSLPKLEVLGPDIICSGTQGCFKGKCVNGQCLCEDFWVGDRCNVRACVATCPKGTRCQDGKCQVCEGGNCGSCQYNCGPHGHCVNETCYCKYGFGGPQCTRPICPTNPQCSGHGACLIGVCICKEGFAGIACQHKDTYAPVVKNLAAFSRDKLHSILADSESLKLATTRAVYRSQLAELESRVKFTYHAINGCLGKARSDEDACSRIQELRQRALDLNVRHKELRKKMSLVEEDAMHGPSERKFGHQENMHVIRELAFSIFANQRRVGVKTGMTSATSAAINTKLAQMWKDLTSQERTLFMDKAKDAIAAEQRAWAMAHELYVDEQLTKIHLGSPGLTLSNSLRGTVPLQDKNSRLIRARIDNDWAALSAEKRLTYYINSSRLAFDMRTNNEKLSPPQSFSMLGTAVENLAFDLFSQTKWLPTFARLSKGQKKWSKRTEMLAAVDRNVLAQYHRLKPNARLEWLDKAKEVLYPKVLFWEKWRNFSTQVLPNFQVVGFQIGLRGTMPRRSNALKSLADTLEAAIGQVTAGAKFKLTSFDAVSTSSAIFSFVLVLASDVHSLSIKVVDKLTECVNSGSFREILLETHEWKITPYFPAGGEPHVVFGSSVTPKCPADYDCGKGVCMNGICSCPSGYAGNDCSEKISCDCRPDRGLCDYVTGRCACYGSWTGKRCDVLACPNDCTGHGLCTNGTCTCNALYTGEDCSERTCQSECSGHGDCCFRDKCTRKLKPPVLVTALEHIIGVSEEKKQNLETLSDDKELVKIFKNPNGFTVSPTCTCQKGYGGGSCGCPSTTPDQECSGSGICFENECWCRAGFSGPACSQATCVPNDCSGHGQCVAGACVCSPGWTASQYGGGCDKKVCLDERCSGHGVCAKGECDCAIGWQGHQCEKPVCPGDPPCSGHGVCHSNGNLKATISKCECTGEWYGEACEQRRCFRDPVSNLECNGKGICQNNICSCHFRWVGPTCSTELCPNKCNWPRGHCVDGHYCQCKPGFKGYDCSEQAASQPEDENDEQDEAEDIEAQKKQNLLKKQKSRQTEPDEEQKEQVPEAEGDASKNEFDSMRGCALCCSQTCEESCQGKSDKVVQANTFSDCFFECQQMCVRDCVTSNSSPCDTPSDFPKPDGPGMSSAIYK